MEQQKAISFDFGEERSVKFSDLSLEKLVTIANGAEMLLDNPDAIRADEICGQLILDPKASEEFRAAQRTKIDNIDNFITALKSVRDRWSERKDRAAKKAKTVDNIITGFLEYVKIQMNASKTSELIGYDSKVVLRTAPSPGLFMLKEIDEDDTLPLKYNDLTIFVPARHEWNHEKIKDNLKAFYKVLKDRADCSDCCGERRVREVGDDGEINFVECESCQGTGKDFSDLEIPPAFEIARLQWSRFIQFSDYVKDSEITKRKPKSKKAKTDVK